MKAMVPCLVDSRSIEYREQEVAMGRGQVLLRHVCSAPSQGTALHMYRGEHLAVEFTRRTRPWPYPWLQGFAYGVGQVIDVGSDVQGYRPGQLVYCMKLLSDVSVASPADVTPLPEGLDPESAALAFQAMVALHGIKEAAPALGDVVLVTGQGPIGILAAQLCRLSGAWRVVATDLSDLQLAISRQVGVDVVLHAARDNVLASVQELTGGRGADLAIEASGSPRALQQCAEASRRLGRIAVIGWIMNTFSLNLAQDFTPKGLDMVVCHAGRGWGPRHGERLQTGATQAELEREARQFLFGLMQEGRLHARELVTHRFPLPDLAKAAEFMDTHSGEYCQILLTS